MTHTMTDDRLIELIETWGAEAVSWPEAERAAGKTLLLAHPERFASALAQARELDQMLGALPEPEMSRALTEAIVAAAPRPKMSRPNLLRWFGLKTPWAPASGFVAAALGLFMGLTVAPVASAEDDMTAEVQELVVSALGFDTAAYALEELE
ncbi:MAG: hypothetical protein CVT79_08695 [Alphaproteobacteria bacterium HGW-Alphaproteobacteria-18]|nr:MAG: hypothetical protein CVT79_08695 [Alphaproteobacteria bacterium HGW-Alphaproteobacteria-18]